MCPYDYYTIMRQSKDPKILRLKMIQYAHTHSIKRAAKFFHTTVNTVKKWLRRFDGSLESITDRSRAPHHRPRKLDSRSEKKIIALKKQLPRFSARRLKYEYDLPWSQKAMRRIFREHGLNRKYRRKKHQTKRCLREIKKQWRFLQQITVDTKDLRDIPEYWIGLKSRNLPAYQYTARDVTTGLLFLGFARELSLAYADIFAQRIIKHLKECGVDLSQTTWQSDNGAEFVGSWQAKDDSCFTKTIEDVKGQVHRTIPPGQHRFQADVETVHSIMEPEFYELEQFVDHTDFIQKANAYLLFFNLARKNSGKEYKTPWQLVKEKLPNAVPYLPLLEVVYLDELYEKKLHNNYSRGYDVWALPLFRAYPNNP
jgi:transposase